MEEIGNDKNSFQKKMIAARTSPLRTYKELTVGNKKLYTFIIYELITFLLSGMPGGLGLMLRKKLYPFLMKSSGKGLIIGRNVLIRHPGNLEVGDNVTVDDNVFIDARGDGEIGVILADEAILNRNVSLKAKTGPIVLGKRTNIGGGSTIVSYKGVEIGESVLVAGGCFINGGGYNIDFSSYTLMEQGVKSKKPIKIGNDVWIATGSIILDGVSIGNHAVIGAGAVVNKNVGEYEVAVGVPAKIIQNRRKEI